MPLSIQCNEISIFPGSHRQAIFYSIIIEPFRICFFLDFLHIPRKITYPQVQPAIRQRKHHLFLFCARKHLPGNLNALPFHISRRRFPVQPDSLIHALRTHAVGQADHTADLSCIQCAQFFHMHASDVTAAARHFLQRPKQHFPD